MKRLGSPILTAAVVAALAAALAACGSAPPVAVTLHRLPLGTAAPAGPAPAVQLSVPAYLDRDALLVSSGGSALVPFGEHRWAEPLAVGAARVLRHEMAGRISAASGTLRVELLAFEAAPDRRTLRLAARWSGADRAEGSAVFSVPIEGGDAEALVAAHRAAIAELAARIARAN